MREKWAAAYREDRDEYVKVMLLCAYLFCVVSASTIGRTAADTLFLSRFDNSALSLMYLPQALVMMGIGVLFQKYSQHIRIDRLIVAVIPFIASLALLSRAGVGQELAWVFPVIYVGYDAFNFLMVMLFWQFAAALMDQRKAKRMIGLVGSGGIAGGIASGFGLKALAPVLGTSNLIYVYAGFQLLALLFVLVLLRVCSTPAEAKPVGAAFNGGTGATGSSGKAGLFKHVPHLKYVALLAACLTLSLTLIDYQFKSILRENLQNEALAGFMGSFYGFSGLLALLVQLFVSGWIITRLGVMSALLVFPIALAAGSLGILAFPVLAMAVMVKGSDKVLGDTVYSSVNQLIMFPVAPEWRGRAKAFLDGIVRNGAKGAAAVCLLITAQLLPPQQLSYLIVVLLGIGIAVGVKVKKAYLDMLLASLQRGGHDLQKADMSVMDPAAIRLLTDSLRSPEPQQALYALRILRSMEGFNVTPHLPELLRHPAAEVVAEALTLMEQLTPAGGEEQLRSMLLSRTEDTNIVSRAVLALAAYAHEEDLDGIASFLERREAEIQTAAIAGLVKYFGIEGMFRAVSPLKQLIDSDLEQNRIAVASLFGQIGVQSFYKPLLALLQDSSPAVRVCALESAASLRVNALLPVILPNLSNYVTRRHAIEALAAYEEAAILPRLKDAMEAGTDSMAYHLPSVCERIGTQAAFDTLVASYKNASMDMRDSMLEALVRMQRKTLTVDRVAALLFVEEELERFQLIGQYAAPLAGAPACSEALLIAVQLRRGHARRIFQLLALLYDAKTMLAVYVNWTEGDARRQANAAEVIDQTLHGKLRLQLTAWMAAPLGLPRSGNAAASNAELEQQLRLLAGLGDDWLKQAAEYAAQRLQGDVLTHRATAELLERIAALRAVPVFEGLASKQLMRIAKRMQPRFVQKGDALFGEGEQLESLILVGSGRAALVVQGRKQHELTIGDWVGELAVFSPERFDASLRADEDEDVHLWVLQADALLDLLFNQTGIAFDMMKLLSRRLRVLLEQGKGRPPAAAAAAESAAAVEKKAALPSTEADPSGEGSVLDELAGLGKSGHQAILRRILALQKIELFSHVSPQDLIWLAQSSEEVSFASGEPICRFGEFGDTMYAILSGSVRVHKGETAFAQLGEGEYFGEMAVIDSGPRSADCTAARDVVALELHRDLLWSFCFQNMSVLRSILRVLADRVRRL